ncbi:uncharacterized protein A4U43_C03F3750 [Asparagus officinalis]|uniref:Uncharacterized protein n=1 Tax=Asparagus officinalis TaxID=4686 RepID=A0A5P1F7M4_ASPOF|nr:uncharacterized protein A4U43_C03F3750 [Asparagus officinalis]
MQKAVNKFQHATTENGREGKPVYLLRELFPFSKFGTSLLSWPRDRISCILSGQSEFSLRAKSSTSLCQNDITGMEINLLSDDHVQNGSDNQELAGSMIEDINPSDAAMKENFFEEKTRVQFDQKAEAEFDTKDDFKVSYILISSSKYS